MGRLASHQPLALLAGLVVACGLAFPASAPGAHARDWRAPEVWPEGAPRVLLLGDSNVYGPLGGALQDRLVADGYAVWRRGKPSTGLSRQDRFDWIEAARQMIAEAKPQVVILQIGGNDVLYMRWREDPKRVVPFRREAEWRAAYGERVREMLTLLAGEDRQVFLLSPTNRGVGAERVARVRDVQREAALGIMGVTFIDMFPLTSDPRGRWLYAMEDARGRRVVVRRWDQVHLNDVGGVLVGERVLSTLRGAGLALR